MKTLAAALMCLGLFACGSFFGGTRDFSLLPVFFIFVFAFAAALLAGDIRENFMQTLRFPPFWAGILFCVHIGIGQANTWMRTVWKYGVSDIYYTNFLKLLPSGVDGFHTNHNTSFAILIMALMWTLCFSSLNLLVKSRGDCTAYCRALVAGALACTFAAFLQYFNADTFQYVWTLYDIGFSNASFGSFFGRTNGVAYVLVGACVLCAVTFRNLFSREVAKSSIWAKTFLRLAALCLMLASVGISGSLGGMIAGAFIAFSMLCIAAGFVFSKYGRARALSFIAVSAAAAIAVCSLPVLNPSIVPSRILHKAKSFAEAGSLEDSLNSVGGGRMQFYGTSAAMIKSGGYCGIQKTGAEKASKIFFGSGANSYGDVSAIFMAGDPRFIEIRSGIESIKMLTYAHCDPLQFLFEYGILWSAVFAAFAAFWVRSLVRAKFWRSAFVCAMAIPLPAMLAYSCTDIIFYNPFLNIAIFFTAFIAYKYAAFMNPNKQAK